MTKYVMDIDKVREVLEEYQSKGNCKYVEVKNIKVRNTLTKNQEVAPSVFLMATGRNSCKPLMVCAVQDEPTSTVYIANRDYTHWNVSSNIESLYIGNGKYILYRNFCNPVLQSHLWDNPDRAGKILKGNLMEGNPNDRYRTPSSVDLLQYCPPLYNYGDGILKSKVDIADVFFRDDNPMREPKPDKVMAFNSIINKLKSDRNYVYAYCTPNTHTSPSGGWEYRLLKQDDLDKYIVSNYYRTYHKNNIKSTERTIPDIETDFGCFGCGSAGSNIMYQVARMSYFKHYYLVDFDKIEAKNVRNQIYTLNDIGSYKVARLKDFINKCRPENKVDYFNDKIENTFLKNRVFKYLVSGFDSCEVRMWLLDKIQSGEIRTRYLIDTRYDDLEASLYFIDTQDKEQIEYYRQCLQDDLDEFKKMPQTVPSSEWTLGSVEQFGKDTEIFDCNCALYKMKITGSRVSTCGCTVPECGKAECLQHWLSTLKEYNYPMDRKYLENSCLKENIIQIYTLTSSWVSSIIREIETNNNKPLTHVELTAEPIPRAMVLRK